MRTFMTMTAVMYAVGSWPATGINTDGRNCQSWSARSGVCENHRRAAGPSLRDSQSRTGCDSAAALRRTSVDVRNT